MNAFKPAYRLVAGAIARPYVSRELPGWGKVYNLLVGDYQRNWLWEGARERTIRGKLNNYLMTLDLASWADRYTYFLGRWYDLETQLLLDAVVRPGDVVVDIGANRGMFALSAAQAVGSSGRVVCFEPNPACTRLIRRECAQNGIDNIEIREFALGREPARLMLSIPRINSGEATLGPSQYADVETVAVEVKVGDEELAGLTPSLLKIDVEGFECEVVDGLAGCLERCRPVILTEVVPPHLERCGASREALFARLEALGYTAFRVTAVRARGRRTAIRLEAPPPGRGAFDAVWLPRETISRYAALMA